ncbi:MAG: GNAT family N-acetyltransferase [Phototrophicaceae bacterium]
MISINPSVNGVATLPDGFTTRVVTMDDIQAATELYNACSQAQEGRNTHSVEETQREWTYTEFDLNLHTLAVFNPQGQMVGYAERHVRALERHIFWARVHPDYENLGLGTYLLDWCEARTREQVAQDPNDTRVVLHVYSIASHTPSLTLFESFGYAPIRHTYSMGRDFDGALEPVQLPDGIIIRPYRHPEELAALAQADMDAFQDHFGYVPRSLELMMEEFRHEAEGNESYIPELWLVAEDTATGQLAGLCTGWLDEPAYPDYGYVGILGVPRPYRKRGIGRALLLEAFRQIQARGKSGVYLYVDASNLTGALRLYEGVGMHMMKDMILYEKELRAGRSVMTESIKD